MDYPCSLFYNGGAVGVAWNCNSLFVKAICEDTGFARSQVVFLTTICSAATMIMSLFISKIYKVVSPIKVMRVAGNNFADSILCNQFL